jgi:hypothetical protein
VTVYPLIKLFDGDSDGVAFDGDVDLDDVFLHGDAERMMFLDGDVNGDGIFVDGNEGAFLAVTEST